MAILPDIGTRISAFARLGEILGLFVRNTAEAPPEENRQWMDLLKQSCERASAVNTWFTPQNIRAAVASWADALQENKLKQWMKPYSPEQGNNSPGKIAVVMAGNIPLVGMHDFVTVLISGNHFLGKLSSNDNILLKTISEILCAIEPGFADLISFTDGRIEGYDAVIATGSNNTSRYFEYYFSHVPHIIRRNRNGTAVLSGNESSQELEGLGRDICLYFGLGCRSISKVYMPAGYDPGNVLEACKAFNEELFGHFKYMNNYQYQKAIRQMNLTPYYDNGMMIMVENEQYASPIAVVNYEFFKDVASLEQQLRRDEEKIQCIASGLPLEGAVPFGTTQEPQLWDYADGVDTVRFLMEL